MSKNLFTSESVSMGHPDKMADQISDAILDAMLQQDPLSRIACETMITTGLVVVAGEVTTTAQVDFQEIVRNTIKEIGYDNCTKGFDYKTCAVNIVLDKQSPDIAQGVNEKDGAFQGQGAGDQGMMFGYATNETPELMPLAISLSHKLMAKHAKQRKNKKFAYLRPDAKAQVTVEYNAKNKPVHVNTVVISTQHDEKVKQSQIKKDMIAMAQSVIPKKYLDNKTKYLINPTGRFVIGGPMGDCGLTGRKIIVDTYGGSGRHGGGAFSGKDPSKVDRSAAYASRYVAKNIVAAKLATKCEVQLAYAIGYPEPVSININTFGTGVISEITLAEIVEKNFDLTPSGIVKMLDLLKPGYFETARHGHFGRTGKRFTWEITDKASQLSKAAGIK